MDNSNIVDFFTKKAVEQQDTDKNDAVVSEVGRYIGVLPTDSAENVRRYVDMLALRKSQIDSMMEDWQRIYDEYAYELGAALSLLRVTEDDLNGDNVFVGEDGHVWLVREEDMEAFEEALQKKTGKPE